MRVAILGAGAWGTALAVSLGHHHAIGLWTRNSGTAAQLREQRRHPSALPGVVLPDAVQVGTRIEELLGCAEVAIVATSVAGARDVLQALARCGYAHPVILACKGFDAASGQLPHDLAGQLLGPAVPVLSLSGPSFASEVAAGLPTALVLAGAPGRDAQAAQQLVRSLHHPQLRLYSSSDPVGVEVCGALKNVIAIAAGMCDGMRLGLNARAALVTRGLAEIRRFGERIGARRETFLGLAGVGDLTLTCTGAISRNYRVGQGLAAGQRLDDILAALGEVAEGVPTTRAAVVQARQQQVDLPICQAVMAVLDGSAAPAEVVRHLLARDRKDE